MQEPRGLRGWVDRRYQITPLFEFLRHKEVPLGSHWMGWYYLGGVTMFFFIVQVITGVLLLMYYQPGEATAYESIRFLTTKVPFGWLIRSIHSWSAHLMIISLLPPHVQHHDAEGLPAAARSHLGLRLLFCFCSRLASAFPDICCRGTSSLISPPRSAPTSSYPCRC